MIAYGREQLTIEYDTSGYIDCIDDNTWRLFTSEDGKMIMSLYGGRTLDRVIDVLELAQWIEEGMA